MAVFSPPDLRRVAWRLGLVYPGQTLIASRLTGRLDTINRGPGLWKGRIAWHIRPEIWADREDAMRWIVQMRGQANQTQLTLPASFWPVTPPSSDYAATVGTVVKGTDGSVTITLTVSAGSWTPKAGNHLTIGNRLYAIESVDSANIRIAPRHEPTVGAAVEAAEPYVIVTPEDPDQLAISFQGAVFDRLELDWIEHLA